MSTFTSRLDVSRLRAKCRRIRERLREVAADRMQEIAARAIEKRYSPWTLQEMATNDPGMLYGRIQKLDAVFIPVTLKHQRREQWPDLWPIYQAMIVRRQDSYLGRYRFWVDRAKLSALRAKVLRRATRRLDPEQWRVVVTPAWGAVRVRVIKQGRRAKGDAKAAAEIVSIIERIFAEEASAILYAALAD